MSEDSGSLPNGWLWTTVAKVGEIQSGQTPKGIDNHAQPQGAVPWFRIGDMNTPGNERELFQAEINLSHTTAAELGLHIRPKGTIVFPKRGGAIATNKKRRLKQPSSYDLNTMGIVPDELVAEYFWWWFQSVDLASLSDGSNVPQINHGDIAPLELPMPPLAEQRRIVAKIETLQQRSQRAREALSEVGPLLEQFRQSVLAAAFRGDLTANWRAARPSIEPARELLHRIRAERRRRWEQVELAKYEAKGQKPPENWKDKYKEAEPVDESDLPELAEGWCWASLEELKDLSPNSLTDGPFGSKLKTSHYSHSGIRVIRLGNIGVGHFNTDDEAFVPQSRYEELRKHEISAGDLVIAALAEPVGRCCKIPPSIGKAIVKADCIRFRPHPSVLPEIVMHWLNSRTGRKLAEMASHGIGRLRINMENLRSLPVTLPPAEEQIEIVAGIAEQLAGIARIQEQVGSYNEDLDQLNHSILAKAFRGELVRQYPGDEPASVLLERIRAQPKRQAKAPNQTSKSHQTSKLGKNSSGLEPQQLTLAEGLRTAD